MDERAQLGQVRLSARHVGGGRTDVLGTNSLLEEVRAIEAKLPGASAEFASLVINRIIDRKEKERVELLSLLPQVKPALPEAALVQTCQDVAASLPDLIIGASLLLSKVARAF